jgi:ubiquinol-cytochrome c reductase cytochrome b subunit
VNIKGWLDERLASARVNRRVATVPGPSFAYVFGWVLVMLLGVEAVTGVALATFYAPTTTDAWASVAYVQDRIPMGWLIRGLHFHGGSALVIVAGIHLVQTALFGAYKKPRELVWWIGILLLLLVLGFAITGYVLRWDQAGYWANQVELGIAAGTPIVGGTIKKLLLGGNGYGNLTLTRFYTLHVILLPAVTTLLVGAHIVLGRRHGTTPRWDKSDAETELRWPSQAIRDALAMALTFAVLFLYVSASHGA